MRNMVEHAFYGSMEISGGQREMNGFEAIDNKKGVTHNR